MLSEGELAQLRTDEAALMPDTCTVTRKGSAAPVFDENTGQYVKPPGTTVYSGACRIAPLNASDRGTLFGERSVDLVGYQATFPHNTPVLEKDDQVMVTASADTQLVNRVLEIHSFDVKSLQTKRRAILQEVRSGG